MSLRVDDLDGMSTGQRIRILRGRRGLSRRVLGELVGRSPEWVKAIETERLHPPRLPMLVQLAEALRLPDAAVLIGADAEIGAGATLPVPERASGRMGVNVEVCPPGLACHHTRCGRPARIAVRHRATVGARLRALRLRRGMSLRVLSGLMGRESHTWLSQLENDTRHLERLKDIRALADALAVPITDIIAIVERTPEYYCVDHFTDNCVTYKRGGGQLVYTNAARSLLAGERRTAIA